MLAAMFPMFIVPTLSLILLCPVHVSLASVMQCNDTTYSIANRVLTGHAFLTKPSPNIEDCVISCIECDPSCVSINYYRKTKVCELNNKTVDSNPDNMVDFEWAIYMTNSLRFLPCNDFDFECGRQTDICLLKKGGSKCKGKTRFVLDEILGERSADNLPSFRDFSYSTHICIKFKDLGFTMLKLGTH